MSAAYHRHPHPLLTLIKWVLIACYWWPLLLGIAIYGYLRLGLAWLIAPAFAKVLTNRQPELTTGQAGAACRVKVADSTDHFTAWLGKASLFTR